ncbi:MAG: hypothetical protein KJZ85_20260 [Rhodobacteraceae bacterium]|jgi:hypothetical protein|nr:hypothetical protein [Paracoccaceae bacterium]
MGADSASELERRIAAALDRIAAGLERTPRPQAGETGQLREALEAERSANAQLTERVRAIKERQESVVAGLERRLARQTELLDVQGLELQRLKKSVIQLREANRVLREAQEAGLADPAAINRSLQAEVEGLRATRAAEIAELDEILAELRPLVGEGGDA